MEDVSERKTGADQVAAVAYRAKFVSEAALESLSFSQARFVPPQNAVLHVSSGGKAKRSPLFEATGDSGMRANAGLSPHWNPVKLSTLDTNRTSRSVQQASRTPHALLLRNRGGESRKAGDFSLFMSRAALCSMVPVFVARRAAYSIRRVLFLFAPPSLSRAQLHHNLSKPTAGGTALHVRRVLLYTYRTGIMSDISMHRDISAEMPALAFKRRHTL